MRKILFRGKAINRNPNQEYRTNYKNGDWVFGLISEIPHEKFKDLLPARMTNVDGISGIEVDYKTFGQYTGLTDKNGTKIFEGDIVIFEQFRNSNIGKILFNPRTAGFEFWWNVIAGAYGEKAMHATHLSECHNMEVIGNIYDNPELLEG